MNREQKLSQEIQRIDLVSPSEGIAKHVKMASSPYLFFRGSAQLMYSDLSDGTIALPAPLNEVPLTTVMGDCHSSNFGFLTEEGSHGDTVIFAPNDFDDACLGHASWDLFRFLVSLQLTQIHCRAVVDGRIAHPEDVSGKAVISTEHVIEAMQSFIQAYTKVCIKAQVSTKHLFQAIDSISPDVRLYRYYRKALRRAAGGRDFMHKSALAKAVEWQDNRLQFQRNNDKFTQLDPQRYQQVHQAFAPYMDDDILDIVKRENQGTGSINMTRYYFLVGCSATPDSHATPSEIYARSHIVEVKQQREAAPLYYFPNLHAANQLNPAHLTAKCQRRMQRRADLLLDEVLWEGTHWLIRSRHHAKVGIDPMDIGLGNKNVNGSFVAYAQYCGKALALAHCRADRRSVDFETHMQKVLPQCSDALIDTAIIYANQVAQDTQWLQAQLPR